jgi:DNA-binding MarR family transcriptional regulator
VEHLPITPLLSADQVLELLFRTSHVLKMELDSQLSEWNMTEARHGLLKLLADRHPEGILQTELARQLMQSESNISMLVDRLQADGVLERITPKGDRRKRLLCLTPAGLELWNVVEHVRQRWAEASLSSLGEERKIQLGLWLKSILRDVRPEEVTTLPAARFWRREAS